MTRSLFSIAILLVMHSFACRDESPASVVETPSAPASTHAKLDAVEFVQEIEDYLGARPVGPSAEFVIADVLARAEQGDAAAQTLAGHIHGNGLGVAVDAKRAAAFYHRGARLGYGPALFGVARAFDSGRGAERNAEQAFWFYRSAAEHGSWAAKVTLARMLMAGEGAAEQDESAAFGFAREAARAGHAGAQRLLASFYANGRGAQRNHVEAYAWAGAAVANGDPGASELRDTVASCCMDEVEVAKATKLAAGYAALRHSSDANPASSESD